MIKIFVLLLIFFIKLSGATHSFLLENDLFAGTDKHYTNGTFYTHMEENVQVPWILDISSASNKSKSLTFSQLMYTPVDISESEKILDDYPYAGHIGLTWSLFQSSNNFFQNMGFSIGSVGPISMAEETQKEVHRARDITIPQGWDHQLDNEPTAGLIYQLGLKTRKLRVKGIPFDWTTNLRFDYGNFYSGTVLGTVIRFGNHFPKNFPTTGSFFGGHESSMLNMKRASGLRWSLSLGIYGNKVDTFYILDEAKEYNVEQIDYTVGDFASINLYYKKFELELQFKNVSVNSVEIRPDTIVEHYGAFSFRWKWD